MPGTVGEAYVRIRPETSQFQSEASSGLKRAMIGIGTAVGGFFAAQQLGGFVKESVQTASTIQKSQEAIQATMGKAGDNIIRINDNVAGSLGLSAKASDEFAARVGLLGQNIGLSTNKASLMALQLEELAGAYGQIKGSDPTPYLDKLSSALLGNTRGLKQLGIAVNSTNELQVAEKMGFITTKVSADALAAAHARVAEYQAKLTEEVKKYGATSPQALGATASLKKAQESLNTTLAGKPSSTVASLTAAQKAQVIMGVATSHLSKLQEEASKHSGDLANQQLKLTAEWSNAKDEIGLALLPAVTKIATVFATNLPGAMHSTAEGFKRVVASIQPYVPPIVRGLTDLFNLIKENESTVKDIVGAFVAYHVVLGGLTEATRIYKDVSGGLSALQKILTGQIVFSTAATREAAAQEYINAAAVNARNVALEEGFAAQTANEAATVAATGAQEAFNAAVLVNPLTIAVVAIAATAVALYELYQRSSTARAIMKEAFNDVKNAGSVAFGFLAHTVFPMVTSALQTVESTSESILSAIEGFWRHWGTSILREVKIIFAPLVAIIRVGLDTAKGYFTLIGDLIHGRWKKLWGDIGHIVGTILGGIVRIILVTLGTILKLIVQAASYLIPAAIALFVKVVKAAWREWNNLPGQIVHVLKNLPGFMERVVPEIISEAYSIGKRLVKGMINGVESLGKSLAKSVEGQIKSGLSSLNPFSPVEHGGELYIGQPIITGTVKALTASESGLESQMSHYIILALQQVTKQALQWVNSNIGPIGTSIVEGICQPVQSLGSQLGNEIVSQARAAIAGAKAKLGIHSPSMLFSQEVGVPISEGILHGLGGLKQGLVSQITGAAKAAAGVAGALGSTPIGTAAVGANQALGYKMMLQHGWPGSMWGALQALWTRESGWNQFAKNASSGAYGIPQSLPANKMASAGSDWLTNPATQIAWGLSYIAGRYGSPAGAWAHELQYGWYDKGGIVGQGSGLPVGSPVLIGAHVGETVLPTHKDKMAGGVNIETLIVQTESPHLWSQSTDVMNAIARKVRR